MTDLPTQQRAKSFSLSLVALILGFLVLILDQVTKYLTYKYIPLMDHSSYWYPYGGIGMFKDFLGIEFSISHMTNKGAAWGFFGDYQGLLVTLRIALILGLVGYSLFYTRSKLLQIPLALIIAGALGNVLDFFTYGHVVDMFHFVFWGYDFPVFNVADSAITLGIVLWFILSWFE